MEEVPFAWWVGNGRAQRRLPLAISSSAGTGPRYPAFCGMRVRASLRCLRRFASSRSVDVDRVDADALLQTMVDWYRTDRVRKVDIEADVDMLLFQWGTDEGPDGVAQFEFDLTRQFIVAGRGDDPAMFQLSWTALYETGPITEAIGSGDQWCDHPDGLSEFVAFVDGSEAARFARSTSPRRVRIEFERV